MQSVVSSTWQPFKSVKTAIMSSQCSPSAISLWDPVCGSSHGTVLLRAEFTVAFSVLTEIVLTLLGKGRSYPRESNPYFNVKMSLLYCQTCYSGIVVFGP